MNIHNYSPGDIIERFDSSRPYSSGVRDRSYMNEKLFFLGILGEDIHFQRTEERYLMPLDKIYTLPLVHWDEGWRIYRSDFKFGR